MLVLEYGVCVYIIVTSVLRYCWHPVGILGRKVKMGGMDVFL